MSFVTAAAIVGGGMAIGSLGAAYLGSQGASEAAQTQAQATQQASQQLQEMYNRNAPYWQPYVNLGTQGVNQLSSMLPYLTQQAPVYKPATAADVMAQLPPNYEFMKQQGLGAVGQALNVGGGGSNIGRAQTRFAEDYASNAYQNALQNYMTQQSQAFNQGQQQQTNIFNRLSGIATLGQQAAGGLSNLGTGTATNIAQLGVQGANATAAGIVGQANALSGGISGLGSAAGTYGMISSLPAMAKLFSSGGGAAVAAA